MPLVIRCEHCQAPLKLPAEFIGREVRCPSCKQAFVAKEEPVQPPRREEPSRDEPDSREPKGVRDRRPDDEGDPRPPRRDEDDEDRPRRARRRDEDDEDRPRRRARYDEDDDGGYSRKEAHRGGSILTMGIFTIVLALCCWPAGLVLGITALVMANGDLGKMQSGYMDRGGESQTNSGRVCAIIGLVLIPIFVVLGCLINIGGGAHGR